MDYNSWQEKSYKEFINVPEEHIDEYLRLGLVAEVGELFGKYAKLKRGDFVDPEDIFQEAGDILWFVSAIAYRHNLSLYYIMLFVAEHSFIDWPVNSLLHDMMKDAISGTVGSLYWIVAFIAELTKTPVDFLLELNYNKLSDRKNRNVIKGNGDKR